MKRQYTDVNVDILFVDKHVPHHYLHRGFNTKELIASLRRVPRHNFSGSRHVTFAPRRGIAAQGRRGQPLLLANDLFFEGHGDSR